MTNISTSSRTNRLWILAAFFFGLMIGGGATGEILFVTWPGAMPPESTEIPFIAKHLSAIGLRSWVFVSNVINLVCAGAFMTAAIQLLRGKREAWRYVSIAATTLGVVVVLSAGVCSWYFFPMPTELGALKATKVLGLSMVGASVGMLAMTSLWRWAAQRHVTAA